MKIENIGSIGWLNCGDGSVNLTPILHGESMPIFVNVSREAFKKVSGNDQLMKELAVKEYNKG